MVLWITMLLIIVQLNFKLQCNLFSKVSFGKISRSSHICVGSCRCRRWQNRWFWLVVNLKLTVKSIHVIHMIYQTFCVGLLLLHEIYHSKPRQQFRVFLSANEIRTSRAKLGGHLNESEGSLTIDNGYFCRCVILKCHGKFSHEVIKFLNNIFV